MSTSIADTIDEVITECAGAPVPVDAVFFEAGLTSSVIVAVHERLQSALGTRFPVGVFFDHPTRQALAEHLTRATAAGQVGPAAVVPEGEWTARSRRDLRTQLRRRKG
ncbi:acyl carrier protein [Actinophytocola sp.]|uniref:acyl carrier protein n=1 Tax=Actinophytocola sp. TaxID=1872138 RepID=UPI00389A1B3C